MEVGDKVQIAGRVKSFDEVGNITLTLEEIHIDEEWKKFNPTLDYDLVKTAYTQELTPQELELVLQLGQLNVENTQFSHYERVLMTSIISKLGGAVNGNV